MARRMTLIVAVILSGAGGVCRGEGGLGDTIASPRSGECKNRPKTKWDSVRADQRMRELISQSEYSGPITWDWETIWRINQPRHMNSERIHGGLE
jgi:hypothetical protein